LLSHGTVRYALHRRFVRTHGMYIKGLHAQGEHWNATSPARILQSKVPGFAQHLLEDRLPHGFNLRETAILAATLEHLVHMEELRMLRNVYKRLGLDPEVGASIEDTKTALETYLVLLPGLEGDIADAEVLAKIPDEQIKQLQALASFQDLLAQMREAMTAIRSKAADSKNKGKLNTGNLTFAEAAAVVRSTWSSFKHWHNNQCKTLKTELAKFEDRGSGRVKLFEFYTRETPAEFAFTESMAYLRQLGALDETDPHTPRVIIPNYVNSATNCVVISSMHWVCCVPESEWLMSHVEEKVGTPMATAQKLVEVVQALPSETVAAPRVLPARLVRRLEDIGSPHKGQVPLHGRLFSQWMHHAYPREVPYPYQADEIKPMPSREWQKEMGTSPNEQYRNITASDLRWMGSQPEAKGNGGLIKIPWNQNEELLGYHLQPSRGSQIAEACRSLAILLVLAVAVVHSNELFKLATTVAWSRRPLHKTRKS